MSSAPNIELEIEYLLGLLDYLSKPTLEPYETQGGYTSSYGLQASVYISLRQSNLLLGILTNFFDQNGINYRLDRRDSDGIPTRCIITETDSISALNELGQGTFIQVAERLEFLTAVSREYEDQPIAGHKERFYRIYEPWVKMDTVRKKEKYTLDFFKNKFDIYNIDDKYETPKPTYPDLLSTAYVAGAFDATGQLSLHINEQLNTKIGYGMGIRARIAASNPDIRVKPSFIQYFQNHNLKPNVQKRDRDGRLYIQFNSAEDVESFVELVGAKTVYLYEMCELFYEQLIPAYKDQYHTTKEGFIDMLEAFEAVSGDRLNVKYTVGYFEEKWDL